MPLMFLLCESIVYYFQARGLSKPAGKLSSRTHYRTGQASYRVGRAGGLYGQRDIRQRDFEKHAGQTHDLRHQI